MASTISSMADTAEDKRLLGLFLNVLRTPGPSTVPEETLFGAITHYLATLSSPDLIEFLATLLVSPALSAHDIERGQKLTDAVRLSVIIKIDSLDKQLESAYFSKYRKDRKAIQWLDRTGDLIMAADSSPIRTYVLLGLVEGLGDVQGIEWGKTKVRLEEELVIEAASAGGDEERLNLLCSTMDHVDPSRLRALNMKAILPQLQATLQSRLRGHDTADRCSQVARAVGKALEVLGNGGPSSQKFVWAAIPHFCLQSRAPERSTDGTKSQSDWEHRKTQLFSFLLPADSIISILIASEPPSTASSSTDLHPSAQIAIELIITLSTFSDLLETSSGGLEGYHKILYGALDVLEAKGGVKGVLNLFLQLKPDLRDRGISSSHAAYILRIGEQLVHKIDGQILRDILFPLAHRHIMRTSENTHEESFEAAHAFLIATIQAATASAVSIDSQRAFLEAITVSYARLLIAQTRYGDIKADQLRAAYPVVTSAASLCSAQAAATCIEILSSALGSHTGTGARRTNGSFIHAVKVTRIAVTPYVTRQELQAYLDDIAEMIVSTDRRSHHRSELVEVAFRVVLEGLPDEYKREGMEWWLRWKDRMEGVDLSSGNSKGVVERARL